MKYKDADQWRDVAETVVAGYYPDAGKRSTFDSGLVLLDQVMSNIQWRDEISVLDLGSGNGRLSMALAYRKMPNKCLGLEIIPECVEWCNDVFVDYPNLTFEHLDVYSTRYCRAGREKPETVSLNVPHKVDLVVAHSVFTHMPNLKAVENYFRNIARILNDDGVFYSSWFFDPPHEVSERGNESKAIFYQDDIYALYEQYNFDLYERVRGDSDHPGDQAITWARLLKGE